MSKTPKIIYAALINLSGLYSKRPVRCTYDENTKKWWSDNGNFDVHIVGLDGKGTNIRFSSTSEKEVQTWINGAEAVLSMIGRWAGNGYEGE